MPAAQADSTAYLADLPLSARAFERAVDALLVAEDRGVHGWQQRLLGGRPSELAGRFQVPPLVHLSVITSRRLNIALTAAAKRRGISKSLLMRLAMAQVVALETGTPLEDWLPDIDPRLREHAEDKGGKAPYRRGRLRAMDLRR